MRRRKNGRLLGGAGVPGFLRAAEVEVFLRGAGAQVYMSPQIQVPFSALE
jgi:hypothetical protein